VFFTPYMSKHNILIVSKKKIAINYITSVWFYIDLISIVPLDWFKGFGSNYGIFVKILKLPRFYRILQIGKIFNGLKNKKRGNSCMAKVQNYFAGISGIVNLLPVFIFVFIMCHCAACIWHFFGWWDDSPSSWVSRNEYRNHGKFDRYVVSMYFIFQTITTVGYGDIGVKTKTEFVLAIFFMFTGVLFYSNILSELLEVINNKIIEHEELKSRLHDLKIINQHVPVGSKLMLEIIRELKDFEAEE